MTAADKKSQRIADDFARQQVEKYVPEFADIEPFFRVKGLTSKQCKVLAVCYLPNASDLTIPQKAAIAGVSVRSWYNITRLPKFLEAMASKGREIIGTKVPSLLRTHISNAISDDGDSLDRRLMLQQVGVLDKPQVATGATQTVIIQNGEVVERKKEVVDRFRLKAD